MHKEALPILNQNSHRDSSAKTETFLIIRKVWQEMGKAHNTTRGGRTLKSGVIVSGRIEGTVLTFLGAFSIGNFPINKETIPVRRYSTHSAQTLYLEGVRQLLAGVRQLLEGNFHGVTAPKLLK